MISDWNLNSEHIPASCLIIRGGWTLLFSVTLLQVLTSPQTLWPQYLLRAKCLHYCTFRSHCQGPLPIHLNCSLGLYVSTAFAWFVANDLDIPHVCVFKTCAGLSVWYLNSDCYFGQHYSFWEDKFQLSFLLHQIKSLFGFSLLAPQKHVVCNST